MGREAMVSEPESVSPERFVASDKRDGDDDGSDQDEPMDIAKATQNWQVCWVYIRFGSTYMSITKIIQHRSPANAASPAGKPTASTSPPIFPTRIH